MALGVAFAAMSAFIVLRTEDATSHPGGLELIGAILWRGVVYGSVDGLLLSAFPILVVFAAFAGSRLRQRRTGVVAIGAGAHRPLERRNPASDAGSGQYRHGDSNPGFRRERAAS